MTIRNLTGLSVTVRGHTLFPDGPVPSVELSHETRHPVGAPPVTVTTYHGLAGLPDARAGVWLLVPAHIARLCWAALRSDVLALEHGELRGYCVGPALDCWWDDEDTVTLPREALA